MDGGRPFDELGDHRLALTTILARARKELVDLGGSADGLQDTISAVVAGSAAALAPNMLMQLQAADALSQRLDGLAQLVRALEASIPHTWALDMRSDGELVRALLRRVGRDRQVVRGVLEEEGDCEIF